MPSFSDITFLFDNFDGGATIDLPIFKIRPSIFDLFCFLRVGSYCPYCLNKKHTIHSIDSTSMTLNCTDGIIHSTLFGKSLRQFHHSGWDIATKMGSETWLKDWNRLWGPQIGDIDEKSGREICP